MDANEYQKLALRTEYTPHFVASPPGLSYDPQIARLIHGMIGVCTEAGELQDQVKKHLIYGKRLDMTNVMEEIGDVLWYCALTLDAAGFTFEECMRTNIDKLRKRFPDKFTQEQALNRDLDAERKALETAPIAPNADGHGVYVCVACGRQSDAPCRCLSSVR